MPSVSDVLDQLFNDCSDDSEWDSGGEDGHVICAYSGNTVVPHSFESGGMRVWIYWL